jgi:hypothetical protein
MCNDILNDGGDLQFQIQLQKNCITKGRASMKSLHWSAKSNSINDSLENDSSNYSETNSKEWLSKPSIRNSSTISMQCSNQVLQPIPRTPKPVHTFLYNFNGN